MGPADSCLRVTHIIQTLHLIQVAEMKRKFPRFAASAIDDMDLNTLPWQTGGAVQQEPAEQLPEAGPSRPICDTVRPLTRRFHHCSVQLPFESSLLAPCPATFVSAADYFLGIIQTCEYMLCRLICQLSCR